MVQHTTILHGMVQVVNPPDHVWTFGTLGNPSGCNGTFIWPITDGQISLTNHRWADFLWPITDSQACLEFFCFPWCELCWQIEATINNLLNCLTSVAARIKRVGKKLAAIVCGGRGCFLLFLPTGKAHYELLLSLLEFSETQHKLLLSGYSNEQVGKLHRK